MSSKTARTTTNTSVGKMESRSTSTKTTTKITSSIKTIGINQNSQQIGNYDEEEYCVPKKSDLTPKKKAKKSRKSDHQKESISVKSSFSKFDALQKRNDLHEGEKKTEKKCRACYKDVYKMEEIRAEQSIWHRNCFRCVECGKQLNVDTYQSHESLLYCRPHFRLLFAPKAVEDNEPQKTRKPELIIRENQPVELPPDVVRASDKPDLGLEELHQLNVKSRFQVFENYKDNKSIPSTSDHVGFKKSTSILSKLAKFQAKGMDVGITDDSLNGIPLEPSDDEDIELNPDGDEDIDVDLILARNASKRERPINFCNMNDIKTKFENGHSLTREERREERKQEIQNIRSRLFMGKQARIKEMYQQAVADSEQGQTSTGKKPEIDIGDMARSLKEKFEKGQIFKNKENNENESKIQDEDVFEQGISKKSRSIFMELDANASKSPQNNLSLSPSSQQISAKPKTQTQVSPLQPAKLKPFTGENVVKCDEKPDDVKIETSEISSKFKFFETYKPDSNKMKKEFRITPPRDGVVKLPSPEHDIYIDPNVIRSNDKNNTDDPIVAETSHTTTKMLSLFRQMEEKKFNRQQHHDDDIDDPEYGLKPLKRFTPPLDENRRFYLNDSDDGDDEEDEEEEEGEEEGEEEENERRYTDEFLKQAQSAARAKQLRAKFEKWEANEIQREMNNGFVQIYENGDNNEHYNDNESQIESAKSLRAKFESMKDINRNPARPTVQVNRFV